MVHCRLPLDVTILMLGYLEPKDVLNVRMTCKRLKESSMQKAVWLEVLRAVMQEHGVPLQTYPLYKFSQPLLEHLALSPRKFLKKLATHDSSDGLLPRSAQILVSRVERSYLEDHSLEASPHFRFLELAPGGRFLVTSRFARKKECSNQFADLIQLWDLGVPSSPYQPKLLATKCFSYTLVPDRPSDPEFHMSLSKNGLSFYFAIHWQEAHLTTPQCQDKLCLFQLKPFEERPTIEHISDIGREDCTTTNITLSSDKLVVVSSNSNIHVYQLKDNTIEALAAWSLHGMRVDSVHIFNQRIFLLENGNISEWVIPPTNVEDPLQVITDHHPIFTFTNLMRGDDTVNPLFLIDNSWISRFHLPDYMVAIRSDTLSLIKMEPRCYCPGVLPDHDIDIFPRHIKTHLDKYKLHEICQSILPCDKNLVFISWDTGLHSEVSIHTVPINTSLEPRSVGVEYILPRGRLADQASLCAATGRMCILADDCDIAILDFLEAPTS